jgi:hypothetical protein
MNAQRRMPPEDVIALHGQGWTQRQIAQQYGVNQASVSELLHRHGVTARRSGAWQAANEARRVAVNRVVRAGMFSYSEGLHVQAEAVWLV